MHTLHHDVNIRQLGENTFSRLSNPLGFAVPDITPKQALAHYSERDLHNYIAHDLTTPESVHLVSPRSIKPFNRILCSWNFN